MERVLRSLRRTIRPNYARKNQQFRSLEAFYVNCDWIIKFFYIVSLIFSYGFIENISRRNLDAADFLWPVAWLGIGNLRHYAVAIPILLFLVNCAAVLKYQPRTLRILFAVLCLFVSAIDNSFGGINHGWHIWFWISFIFIFLPGDRQGKDRGYKLATLSVIVYVQAAILLFYTMAGSQKLVAGVKSLIAGEMGNFSLLGFSSLLADRMVQGRGTSILGGFFVDNPYLGFPVFIALILIQTFSLPVVFIPRLQRTWGTVLIGFHLGTGLLMDIYFASHILWLALFLVCSPFRVDHGKWHRIDRNWFE